MSPLTGLFIGPLTSLSTLCALWLALASTFTPLCSAQPSAARLAVLEVQGSYGTLQERLRYSDTLRQEALKLISPLGISVIDRSSLELLLPPSRSLSDCVGVCSAEVARMVGAHWSLSAHMDLDQESLHITLKLHSAQGELLAIAQKALSHTSAPPLKAQLPSALRALTHEALAPLSPSPTALSPSAHPQELQAPQAPQASPSNERSTVSPASQPQPLTWRFVSLKGRAHKAGRCVSGPVSDQEYMRCVEEGACEPLNTLNGCLEARQAHAQARCVSFSNALSFAQWRAERAGLNLTSSPRLLPTLRELKRAQPPELSSAGLNVWVTRPQSPRAPLSAHALKVAPREPLASVSRRGGGLSTRLTPPAFKLKEIGLVISLPADTQRACEQLSTQALNAELKR
jgi:hypothetical protein